MEEKDVSKKPQDIETAGLLSDEQCGEFRRLPMNFNDMVRAIHKAGYEKGYKEMQGANNSAVVFSR